MKRPTPTSIIAYKVVASTECPHRFVSAYTHGQLVLPYSIGHETVAEIGGIMCFTMRYYVDEFLDGFCKRGDGDVTIIKVKGFDPVPIYRLGAAYQIISREEAARYWEPDSKDGYPPPNGSIAFKRLIPTQVVEVL